MGNTQNQHALAVEADPIDVVPMEISRRILENLSTAVLVFDNKLRVIAINPAGEMLFAISAKQSVGQTLSQWLPANKDLEVTLHHAIKSQHPITNREAILRLPGRRTVTVDYTITPVEDDETGSSVIVEMAHVDRVLRLVEEEKMLHRHTTNRAVIRGVAHEIKNPLGGIRGAAQLLDRELRHKNLQEYTRIIIGEADRLRKLIDRMLGPTRPLKKDVINIHEILEHIHRLVRAEIQQGLDIALDYDPSLPELYGDRDQLVQAILNIVRNSAQALNNQGKIIFRTRGERQFTVGQKRHRLVLRVDIEDDGPGIPEEMLEDIFFPLVTGRAEGTGLGLAITQDIIARHGGLIQCSSQPQRTVFSIYLPMERENGSDG